MISFRGSRRRMAWVCPAGFAVTALTFDRVASQGAGASHGTLGHSARNRHCAAWQRRTRPRIRSHWRNEAAALGVPKKADRLTALLPMATHAWHDHRTARPEFLHIGGVAHPYRVGSRKIVRIDFVRLDVRIDAKPCCGPASPARHRRVVIIGLREPDPGRCGLRFRNRAGQQENARESHKNCHSPHPYHHVHPLHRDPWTVLTSAFSGS